MTSEQKAKELYTDHENMFAAKRLGFLAGYQYAQECRREELEKIIGEVYEAGFYAMNLSTEKAEYITNFLTSRKW